MKEEAEELKITLVEKTEQLQEYRIKVSFCIIPVCCFQIFISLTG